MSYQTDFWISNIPKLHSRQFNCKPFSALCLIFFKAAHMSVLQLVHVQAKVQVKMVAGQWCNYKLSDQFADIYLARQAAVFHWVYSSCWSFQLDHKKRLSRGSLSFFFKTRWPVQKAVALVCGLEMGIRNFWKSNLRIIPIMRLFAKKHIWFAWFKKSDIRMQQKSEWQSLTWTQKSGVLTFAGFVNRRAIPWGQISILQDFLDGLRFPSWTSGGHFLSRFNWLSFSLSPLKQAAQLKDNLCEKWNAYRPGCYVPKIHYFW